jgi:hypothetical protein
MKLKKIKNNLANQLKKLRMRLRKRRIKLTKKTFRFNFLSNQNLKLNYVKCYFNII